MTGVRHIPIPGSMPVLVITERNSSRSDLLVLKLKEISQFEVIMVEAMITPNYALCHENNILFNQKMAKIFIGRELLPGEIGCAFSHYSARRIISNSKFGGVILEDDARIRSPEIFFKSAVQFLQAESGNASILSLAGWNPVPLLENQDLEIEKSVHNSKLLGVPPLALGYVLTPLAAKNLMQGGYPIKETADWPSSKCSFFVTNKILAFHGDGKTPSIIDYGGNSLRSRPNLTQRLRTILFIDFIIKKSCQINFRTYFTQIWLRKLYFYIDSVRMFLRRK
jgi:hypothetical protein